MCELLAMSANVPTDIRFSFTGLVHRGGRTGPHRDGWGVAFYEGRGLRLFNDPEPSADSELAALLQRYPIRSEMVIAHIRQANVGAVCLANTHPFVRELWGYYWCCAHNGQLHGFQGRQDFYRPVGSTDSEAAFCDLLSRIRAAYPEPVGFETVLPVILEACAEYRRHGVLNLLLGNGDWLFVFCGTRLTHITRRAPFAAARLSDADVSVDFSTQTTPKDVVTVFATAPLTDNEVWEPLQAGQWQVWQRGECVAGGQLADE